MITPEELGEYERVQDIRLFDVDASAGTATVDFRIPGGYGWKRGYLDLDAGNALPWPARLLLDDEQDIDDSDILNSPDGDKLVRGLSNPTISLTIEDSKGRKIGELPDEDIRKRDIVWSPDGSALIYRKRSREHSGIDLFVYPLKKRSPTKLLSGDTGAMEWTPNNRYLVILEVSTEAAVEKVYRHRKRVGRLHLFDTRLGYSSSAIHGEFVKGFQFSADSSKIAFAELAEDEFGYYDNTVIRVLNISSGKISDVVSDRRDISFTWAGSRHIAATAFDKYAVPMLNLYSLSGEEKELISLQKAKSLTPIVHLPAGNKIIYKVTYGGRQEELWSIIPGEEPVRLIPAPPPEARDETLVSIFCSDPETFLSGIP